MFHKLFFEVLESEAMTSGTQYFGGLVLLVTGRTGHMCAIVRRIMGVTLQFGRDLSHLLRGAVATNAVGVIRGTDRGLARVTELAIGAVLMDFLMIFLDRAFTEHKAGRLCKLRGR